MIIKELFVNYSEMKIYETVRILVKHLEPLVAKKTS